MLEHLVQSHLPLWIDSLAPWKHSCAAPDLVPLPSGTSHVIIISKNPHSWLLSMYRRPYALAVMAARKNGMNFSSFIRRPFPRSGYGSSAERIEYCLDLRQSATKPSTVDAYETPMEMWSLKLRAAMRVPFFPSFSSFSS